MRCSHYSARLFTNTIRSAMKRPPDAGVVIEYSALGTMSVDEFRRAIWTDLEVLKDQYNVKYVKNPALRFRSPTSSVNS